ncbi:SLBB domain-containing protein [Geosporobacter ferrireducens]|uniref:NADH dehydrogenase n=1 Tax=Geosporobacter ferrireducens TaxID=1424294 RepID=A0A1D8GP44_9FIRM|nr:SLBB domain-containing protein [Geosporobacter ferrireducens]AOT72721.1 NADH dehydrogenase [Geosporobacter ferrireducens]MTI55131.1 electron transport complex protein RnfC [Geosporobacter ferrireducens]
MGKNLISLIEHAGIVGAGGAGFPTHVKMNAKVEYIIVNGAECEPLLRVDQQLMAEKSFEILSALDAVIKNTCAQKGYIALKKKYHEAVTSLEEAITAFNNMEIFQLGNFYPAGDEQVTVYEVLNRIVPEGGIPLDVGVIVINVETLLNVYNAIKGAPVTEKYLTVTGAVKNPLTLKVPVGISIAEAIELAGGATVQNYKVIDGGPMMGKIVDDIQKTVSKTTKGLIILPEGHPLLRSKEKNMNTMLRMAKTACMHCSLCTEVCPRNLLGHRLHPDKLIRLASYSSTCEKETSVTEAFLCCECALCEYACVMDLQPWKLHILLKSQMHTMGMKNPHKCKPQAVHPYRQYKQFPVTKLIARLGLEKYDVKAPLREGNSEEFNQVKIPLKQHIGIKADPIVSLGERVQKGQEIGTIGEGKLGARIHASISGVIEKIDDYYIVIKGMNAIETR